MVLRARGQLLRSERGQGVPYEGTGAIFAHGGSGHDPFRLAVEPSKRHPDARKKGGPSLFWGRGSGHGKRNKIRQSYSFTLRLELNVKA